MTKNIPSIEIERSLIERLLVDVAIKRGNNGRSAWTGADIDQCRKTITTLADIANIAKLSESRIRKMLDEHEQIDGKLANRITTA